MLTMSKNGHITAGIQNDHPYQPVPSRIGILVMRATRLIVLATAFYHAVVYRSPDQTMSKTHFIHS